MIAVAFLVLVAVFALYEIITFKVEPLPKKPEPEEPWAVKAIPTKKIEVPLTSKVILNEEIKNIKLEREAGNFETLEDALRKPGEE